jgi:hypothetical protein
LSIPEIGKIYKVRTRLFQIIDIGEFNADIPENNHLLLILEDIETAKKLKVIHRVHHPIETDAELLEGVDLLDTLGDGVDRTEDFDAFITALRWSTDSIFNKDIVRAPFYSNVKLNHFQLEPLVRALNMPRTSLLIADDVGLGKTIEAGLIIQEFMLRKKIKRILIVCPASLKQQWRREMKEKFAVDFDIMDAPKMAQLRREYGVNVNPWTTCPRLITSLDFIKREENLSKFKSADAQWDFLVLDEAHNAMPQPTAEYYKDSERSKAVRQLSRQFEHKVFLTATPHNGKTESFVALMDMLDPEHFNRGQKTLDTIAKNRLEEIMIRRLKKDIGDSIYTDGVFPKRRVEAIEIEDTDEEKALYDAFERYRQRVTETSKTDDTKIKAVEFTFEILKKRLLSSYTAFSISIKRFFEKNEVAERDNSRLIAYTLKKLTEDYDNDLEKQEDETELISYTSRTLKEADGISKSLPEMAESLAAKKTGKQKQIERFIDDKLKAGGEWNGEKLIIFTEYKDTLDDLRERLGKKYTQKRIMTLYGGMNEKEREIVKTEFEKSPERSEGRILLATDAASEGINLQSHCRYMIHNEIPWNPIRLEQRNGRIHRIGQKRDVYIYHFAQKNNEDSQILKRMVEKVSTIESDINTSEQILADQVRSAIMKTQREITKADVRISVAYAEKSRLMKKKVDAAIKETRRRFGISEDSKRQILERAIRLKTNNAPGAIFKDVPNTDRNIVTLQKLPQEWQDLKEEIEFTYDHKPVKRQLTFEDPYFDSPYTHIHLNHPLIKRSMIFYRSQIWNMSNSHLERKTVRVAKDIDDITLRIYLKSTVTDAWLNRISEDVITMDLYFLGDDLEEYASAFTCNEEHRYNQEKKKELTKKIMNRINRKNDEILRLIENRNRTYLQDIKEKWESEKRRTIDTLQKIIDQQRVEIKNDIEMLKTNLRRLKKATDQIDLFKDQINTKEEINQIQMDIEYLEHKQKELISTKEAEIKKLEQTTIRGEKVLFPFALEIIIPAKEVR